MKKKSIIIGFLLSVGIMGLWGCGSGGPGQPGSVNSEDTGVQIEAFPLTPTYLGTNTYSVDVVQQICQPGPPPVFEKFTDHNVNVTFTARLLNPNPPIKPGVLYIEKYTIEYKRSPDSIGSPAIETDTRFDSIAIDPPLSGLGTTQVTATLLLVDLKRKDKYLADMNTGQFTSGLALINNYTATYTFEGKNQYGESFSFKAQTNFQIGSFNYCS